MTERMIEKLFPTIKQQVSFMRHVSVLRQKSSTESSVSGINMTSSGEGSSLLRYHA